MIFHRVETKGEMFCACAMIVSSQISKDHVELRGSIYNYKYCNQSRNILIACSINSVSILFNVSRYIVRLCNILFAYKALKRRWMLTMHFYDSIVNEKLFIFYPIIRCLHCYCCVACY